MELQDIYDLVAADREQVDDLIRDRLHSEVVLINQIGHYIVNSGGKRLRPVLVLLAARGCGYQGPHHIELAAVIEFIHTATLLHDDVVDSSELRRGRETANSVWGNEASVLVGDFLYSRSFQMMVAVGEMRVMEILSDTTNTIAEGEVKQLLNCHDPGTTEARYLDVIRCKTAKLFEAGARIGAVLGGRTGTDEDAMAAYGMHLGTAYQLVDDVLDYTTDSEQLGKNIGDDLAEGKPTLPLIYAMENGNAEQRALIREAIESGGNKNIDAVREAIETTGAITYTSRFAQAEAERAVAALAQAPESPYKDALTSLAAFTVQRTY